MKRQLWLKSCRGDENHKKTYGSAFVAPSPNPKTLLPRRSSSKLFGNYSEDKQNLLDDIIWHWFILIIKIVKKCDLHKFAQPKPIFLDICLEKQEAFNPLDNLEMFVRSHFKLWLILGWLKNQTNIGETCGTYHVIVKVRIYSHISR